MNHYLVQKVSTGEYVKQTDPSLLLTTDAEEAMVFLSVESSDDAAALLSQSEGTAFIGHVPKPH